MRDVSLPFSHQTMACLGMAMGLNCVSQAGKHAGTLSGRRYPGRPRYPNERPGFIRYGLATALLVGR